LKFGGDFNFVRIPSAVFELNFAGLFNFGDFRGASNFGFPAGAPAFTPVQSYGLGLPSKLYSRFRRSGQPDQKHADCFFAQDTWKATRRLTLNYGIRYDVELTQTNRSGRLPRSAFGHQSFGSDILAAQDALGVQQGFPRDTNNFAPRFGFAYDIFGDGKTVVRGALGLFYDHPLLAAAFNSDIADAAQQQQAVLTAGSPAARPLSAECRAGFSGNGLQPATRESDLSGGIYTPGVAPTAQYQFGRQRFNDQTFTGFGAVLPFTLPVAKDFQYASATQANLTFERN
jgi:hypothetical protein